MANAPLTAGGWTPLHKACNQEGNPAVAALVLVGGGCRFAKTTQCRTPLELTTSKAIRELFRLGIDHWQHRHHAQHAMNEVARTLLLVDQRLDANAALLAPHMPAALPHLAKEIWLVALGFLRSADFMQEPMSGADSDPNDVFAWPQSAQALQRPCFRPPRRSDDARVPSKGNEGNNETLPVEKKYMQNSKVLVRATGAHVQSHSIETV